jgi:predicted kinase/diadenosine tetraphosphatase ApaH/serine/threonine PP2A family protein phosphatase
MEGGMTGIHTLCIPDPALLVLVGPSGSGKTTFCRRHFRPTQIVGSDACRALLCDDEDDQDASGPAFELAHRIAEERLRRGRPTVFDATNLEPQARRALLAIAARHHLPAVALVFDLPRRSCLAHDTARADRRVGSRVIARQHRALHRQLSRLEAEGFAAVHRLRSARQAARARVRRVPLSCNRVAERGPFDVIGDVHGCAGELAALLTRLGYRRATPRGPFRHPAGRRAVLVGDLVDRGPRVIDSVRMVMAMVRAGSALCVPGNRDLALLECLLGRRPADSAGLQRSMREVAALAPAERRRFVRAFRRFLDSLPPHLVLDGGRLAVAHAGLKDEHVGRDSEEVRRFALYGETTGRVDRYGLPVRVKWGSAYAGRAFVVYGHTPVPEPERLNNTLNIDTGCVYGGKLTALRYPEMRILSVAAERTHYQSPRLAPRGVGLRAETRVTPPAGGPPATGPFSAAPRSSS